MKYRADYVTNSSSASYIIVDTANNDGIVWLNVHKSVQALGTLHRVNWKELLFDRNYFKPGVDPYCTFVINAENKEKAFKIFEDIAKSVSFDEFSLGRYMHELMKEHVFKFNPDYQGFTIKYSAPAYFDLAKIMYYYPTAKLSDEWDVYDGECENSWEYQDEREFASSGVDEFLMSNYKHFPVLTLDDH